MYLIRFSKQADKDIMLLKGAGLDKQAKELLNIIAKNPFQNPPPAAQTGISCDFGKGNI